MKAVKVLSAAVLTLLSSATMAGTTLTFEGLTNQSQILATYKGLGIEFSPIGGVLTSITDTSAGGQFAKAPSGVNAAAILDADHETSSFRVNVANGFSGSFSLWFAGIDFDSELRLYGRDANGKDVQIGQSLALAAGQGDTDSCLVDVGWSSSQELAVCTWRQAGFSNFAGTAYAVEISGPSGLMFFDDMSFGQLLPGGTQVPEPGSLALLAAAAGAAALVRRRKSSAG